MAGREVVVLSGVRTAIGDYGGSLKDTPVVDLAAKVVKEAMARAKADPKDIAQCVIGNVIHGEPSDMYVSRVACINGGLPHETMAITLNRLCGSGLQAIVCAAQSILLGDADAAVAGGAESMSRAGYNAPSFRWGQRMSDGALVDMMVGALTDPFDTIHMGVTAENVAKQVGHLPRPAGRFRGGKPPSCRVRDRGRPLQGTDPPDRAQDAQRGRWFSTPTSTRAETRRSRAWRS